MYLGDIALDQTIYFKFSTHKADGTPVALIGGVISVYKANSLTQTPSGVTLDDGEDHAGFDGLLGLNHVTINTAPSSYEAGNDFSVVITEGTVDGVSVVGTVLATFSIENRPDTVRASEMLTRVPDITAVTVNHDGNDITSGTTLKAAILAATAGQVVRIGAGNFDIGINVVRVPDYVTVRGAGMDTTRILSQYQYTGAEDSYCDLSPGNYSLVEDLTVVANSAASPNSAHVFGIGSADPVAVGWVARRVRGVGGLHGYYVNSASAVCGMCFDCIWECTYEHPVMSTGAHRLWWIRNLFLAHGSNGSNLAAMAMSFGPAPNAIGYLIDCIGYGFEQTNDPGSFGKGFSLSTGKLYMFGGRSYGKSTYGTSVSLNNNTGTLVAVGVEYDRGTATGTIIDIAPHVTDKEGAAVAPAATALSNATWTAPRAAKLDAIGTASVTIVSPVSVDGDELTIVRGDDYKQVDGRAIEWSSANWPTLTGATVTLTIRRKKTGLVELTTAGTVVDASTVRVELPNTLTGALVPSDWGHSFDVQATLAETGNVVTLVLGKCRVLEDQTE